MRVQYMLVTPRRSLIRALPTASRLLVVLPLLVLASLASGVALAENPAKARKWSFQIEPYLIAVNIDGDAGIGRITGVDLDLSTSDILDTLDLAGMVHFGKTHMTLFSP